MVRGPVVMPIRPRSFVVERLATVSSSVLAPGRDVQPVDAAALLDHVKLVIIVGRGMDLDRLREGIADAAHGYAFAAVGDGDLEIERGAGGAVGNAQSDGIDIVGVGVGGAPRNRGAATKDSLPVPSMVKRAASGPPLMVKARGIVVRIARRRLIDLDGVFRDGSGRGRCEGWRAVRHRWCRRRDRRRGWSGSAVAAAASQQGKHDEGGGLCIAWRIYMSINPAITDSCKILMVSAALTSEAIDFPTKKGRPCCHGRPLFAPIRVDQ